MIEILILLSGIRLFDIVLTYDDGPIKESYKLVDYLYKENISAMFFPILYGGKDKEKIIEYIIIKNHEVGNHTYSHLELPNFSKEKGAKDILKTHNLINKYTNNIFYFRFPSGKHDKRIYPQLKNLGYTHILFWNFSSQDILRTSSEKIVKKFSWHLKSQIRKEQYSSIVLFHDCIAGVLNRTKALVDFVKETNKMTNLLERHPVFFQFSSLKTLVQKKEKNDKIINIM